MADPRSELAGRIMGFMLSQAVYVAAELRVADLIGGHPWTAAELAAAAGADEEALYRLLRLLAGYGIFVEGEGRTFANSEQSELLREGPGSFREFALVFGEEFYPAFGETLSMARTGEPAFDAVFGAEWDDYLAGHPDKSTRFNRFMQHGKEALAEALAALEWRGDETIVDVGGGNGALLVALLERLPHVRGIVFDLPHVAAEAEERVRAAGLADRCATVGGSYFDGVPAGEVYVLSHILHGWDGERAVEILRSVRRAIPPDGRLLVNDGVLGPDNPGVRLMDVLMLSLGGRERTEDEWRELFKAGGFELRTIHTPPSGPLLEAAPA